MTAPQKTHYADDETLMRMAELEGELADLRSWKEGKKGIEDYFALRQAHQTLAARCRALELSARKSAEEAEELKSALRFYADENKYRRHKPTGDYCGVVIIPVCLDGGEIARRALQNG